MHKADADDVAMLKAYVAESFSSGDAGIDRVRPRSDVTVVMYFFWNGDAAPGKWPDFEGALLATWRCCGCLPTVVVSNANHPCVVDFAARYSNVQVQIEDSLAPGDINAMSIDCNARLYARFSTKYVLIVQDDGFPIRPGLDEFVEMGYDFIGAPYCRPSFLPNLRSTARVYLATAVPLFPWGYLTSGSLVSLPIKITLFIFSSLRHLLLLFSDAISVIF